MSHTSDMGWFRLEFHVKIDVEDSGDLSIPDTLPRAMAEAMSIPMRQQIAGIKSIAVEGAEMTPMESDRLTESKRVTVPVVLNYEREPIGSLKLTTEAAEMATRDTCTFAVGITERIDGRRLTGISIIPDGDPLAQLHYSGQ